MSREDDQTVEVPRKHAGPEPTSACVLLFHPDTGLVLAVEEGVGYGLPGGKREPTDADIEETARRELLEETGVAHAWLEELVRYRAGPHLCACFLAVGDLTQIAIREDLGARWVEPEILVGEVARFPEYVTRAYAALATRSARGVFGRIAASALRKGRDARHALRDVLDGKPGARERAEVVLARWSWEVDR
jgi:8-oxo-dGTP pyrophosphatase MutT (NUDIX family)